MAGTTNFVFERVEKKYLLTREKYNLLLEAMEPYMSIDSYGKHTIGNVYYDTDTYELISRSIEKPKYKEKFRVRSYGIPKEEDKVFLEIKKKYKGIVYKRRVSMTLKEAEDYLEKGIRPKKEGQILKEIDYFLSFYKPTPKVYLAYDRMAYFGKENKDIRITFDHNIRSRQCNMNLAEGDYGTPILDEYHYLMEIKVPGAMPLWLSKILSDLEIYPTSFSKYGNVYKQFILPNRRKVLCSQAY
ncbi:MAG: polyphosphate polymerase domain-containing protein [Candidatus Cellulosilyticum pullistercoris]|uniref:Polyphosphate polymerase domain-containing protein n=1 Tax=Candidatus Cellulosilyticum pullistercoris TaxID=2838521 RepID=A0A9E2KAZ9_9FIRM|nr:polyphosphate polymerase domain-containing protein [Candidatus Cellulosilyticum pullistercoris]